MVVISWSGDDAEQQEVAWLGVVDLWWQRGVLEGSLGVEKRREGAERKKKEKEKEEEEERGEEREEGEEWEEAPGLLAWL